MRLHLVEVLEISPGSLPVGPIEAIDGIPVIDIKPALDSKDY
jgi:tRNA (Thr-GGU) A37 N-methylase